MLGRNIETLQDSFPDPVRAIKAVGDRTRLQILRVLLEGEHCVTDIARRLGLAQPRISHHLTILRNSGLVLDTIELVTMATDRRFRWTACAWSLVRSRS